MRILHVTVASTLASVLASCSGGGGGGGVAPGSGASAPDLVGSTPAPTTDGTGFFLGLDAVGGRASAVGGYGPRGLSDVSASEFDTSDGTLLTLARNSGLLSRFDPLAGSARPLGPIAKGLSGMARNTALGLTAVGSSPSGGEYFAFAIDEAAGTGALAGGETLATPQSFESLAFDGANTFGVSTTSDYVFILQTSFSLGTTTFGSFSFLPLPSDEVRGLARYLPTNTFLGVDDATDTLVVVNPSGSTTTVGSAGAMGLGRWESLAYDPATTGLYAVDADGEFLVEVDPIAGTTTPVAMLGARTRYIAWDDLARRLVAFAEDAGLVELDTQTGSASPLGAFAHLVDVTGIAHDPLSDTIYAARLAGSDSFVSVVDPVTNQPGASFLIGGIPGSLQIADIAFDPTSGSGVLYAVQVATQNLLRIDPAASSTSIVGNIGFFDVEGLAVDPSGGGVLYGYDEDTDQLLTIDRTSGAGTSVGRVGIGAPLVALTFDPTDGTLYGTTVDDRRLLVRVDTATGAGTAVGCAGYRNVEALAHDPAADVVYGVDALLNYLVRFDAATGEGTFVAELSDTVNCLGLAFDSSTSTLYGVDGTASPDTLITIDTTDGSVTFVGGTGSLLVDTVRGLAYDSSADVLYGVDGSRLKSIDRTTGAATDIGEVYSQAGSELQGLAFDRARGVLLATVVSDADDFSGNLLLEVDPATAAATVVGETQWRTYGLASRR